MGNKITMAEYGKLAAQVLNLPRKTRYMLESLLAEKRNEDANDDVGKTYKQNTPKKATEAKPQ